MLTATEDQNIWSKATHGDCVLDLEFKFEPGANCGDFFYNSNETNWMHASIEIQICDEEQRETRRRMESHDHHRPEPENHRRAQR